MMNVSAKDRKHTLAATALYVVRAAAFLSILTSTSAIIVAFQLAATTATTTLIPVMTYEKRRRLYRNCMRFSQRLFGSLILVLTYVFAPVDIILTGDHEALKASDFTVLFANHQIYTDWWYIWLLAWHKDAHGDLKIMLKESLANIPIFGWGMTFFEFIFMTRKYTRDHDRITTNVRRAQLDGSPMWLLMFPEGTVNTDDTREKSMAYMRRGGGMGSGEHPRHVILPRSRGLYLVLETLMNAGSVGGGRQLHHVFDLTIGYSGLSAGECAEAAYPLDRVFFGGRGPAQVHVRVEKISLCDVAGLSRNSNGGMAATDVARTTTDPNGTAVNRDFDSWLRMRFAGVKESQLAALYATGALADAAPDSNSNRSVISVSPRAADWRRFAALVIASIAASFTVFLS